MAIRLIEEYPNRVGAPTADYPHGVPRNKSTPTATDGTPFEQSWFRDQEGFFQGLMETAGITPSGQPDTVLNSDYLDALNRVTNGVIEVDMGGAADVSISTYQGRVAALKLTGALAADVDLIVPDTERMYWIIDETIGDFSVTVKTAAGTGVKLFGEASVVRSDGTNVVPFVNGMDRRVIYVDTIADLKAMAGLQLGNTVRTLGYYSPGDGGGNDYEIVASGTGTDDGGSFIDLDNGLQARGLFNGEVNVKQFGAVGDYDPSTGVGTNDAPFIQAASNYISRALRGAELIVNGRVLIDSSLSIGRGVTFKGSLKAIDLITPPGAANYQDLLTRSVIYVNPLATIDVGMASLEGVVLMRKGLVTPFADATEAANGIAAFAGTAIRATSYGSVVKNCFALGFEKLLTSAGNGRQLFENLKGDCTNGLEIGDGSFGIIRADNCHMWPYLTANQTWTTNALLQRSGTAYNIRNTADWAMFHNCFSYGYFEGFRVDSVNSCTLSGCGADNTSTGSSPDHAGSKGFIIDANSNGTVLLGCRGAANNQNIVLSSTATSRGTTIQSFVGHTTNIGILVNSGDVSIQGGELNNCQDAIYINNSTSKVSVGGGIQLKDISNLEVRYEIPNPNVEIGEILRVNAVPNRNLIGGAGAASGIVKTIASADPLPLPANGSFFNVSGTTSFGALSSRWPERIIYLRFDSSLTVFDGSINMAGNFTTSAGSVLCLVCDGSTWHEVSRSAN